MLEDIIKILDINFQVPITYRFQNLTYLLMILTKNVYVCLVKLPFLPKKVNFEKSLNTPLESHINIICTQSQLSNPYQFRKVALDGMTGRLAQNSNCIVALRQLKTKLDKRNSKNETRKTRLAKPESKNETRKAKLEKGKTLDIHICKTKVEKRNSKNVTRKNETRKRKLKKENSKTETCKTKLEKQNLKSETRKTKLEK